MQEGIRDENKLHNRRHFSSLQASFILGNTPTNILMHIIRQKKMNTIELQWLKQAWDHEK